MTLADELLLAEYNNTVAVAQHLDTLRNALTSFFLTLNGAVLVAASTVLKSDKTPGSVAKPEKFLFALVLAVAIIGTLFVAIIARMRRIQFERYHIANGILDQVLVDDTLRRLVPHVTRTFPTEVQGGKALDKRTTGSYLWTMALMLPSAAFHGFAVTLIFCSLTHLVRAPQYWLIGIGVAAFALWVADTMYFRLSKYTAPW